MNKKFGAVQGRLINPPNRSVLQYFPPNWIHEITLAKKIKLEYIEFFKDRDKNNICPFYYEHGFKAVKKILGLEKFKSYSFCDDFFINNNILKLSNYEKYFNNISKHLKSLKIKIYILPLYEKSDLNSKNFKKFTLILKKISKIFKKKKIKLSLETNLDVSHVNSLFKLIKSDNIFLVYDSGNRLKFHSGACTDIIELNSKIIHLHIKDKNFYGENVVLGEGKVDFMKIFTGLKQINYKGNFSFETNRGKNPLLTMKNNIKFIRNIAKKIGYNI